jgi:AraC-like DNA-binding protein
VIARPLSTEFFLALTTSTEPGDNARRELCLDEIARHSEMSTRTLLRRFGEQTETARLQWLRRAHPHLSWRVRTPSSKALR